MRVLFASFVLLISRWPWPVRAPSRITTPALPARVASLEILRAIPLSLPKRVATALPATL